MLFVFLAPPTYFLLNIVIRMTQIYLFHELRKIKICTSSIGDDKKNVFHQRGKSMNQNLLEMVQVTAPIFDIILKKKKVGPKNINIFTAFVKLVKIKVFEP